MDKQIKLVDLIPEVIGMDKHLDLKKVPEYLDKYISFNLDFKSPKPIAYIYHELDDLTSAFRMMSRNPGPKSPEITDDMKQLIDTVIESTNRLSRIKYSKLDNDELKRLIISNQKTELPKLKNLLIFFTHLKYDSSEFYDTTDLAEILYKYCRRLNRAFEKYMDNNDIFPEDHVSLF